MSSGANQSSVDTKGVSTEATSTRDQDSLATLVPEENDKNHADKKHKSWFKKLTSPEKGSKEKKKKDSISDSGPYIFAFDPNTGKEVLQKNPHWPNDDSWKRVEASEGQWAFGSMGGQQNADFGGTVG